MLVGIVAIILALFGNTLVIAKLHPDYYFLGVNGVYREGDICFVGDPVEISLQQSTIEGAHEVKNIHVEVLGHEVTDIWGSGRRRDYIKYESELKSRENVGRIRFRLPEDANLYGRVVDVSYSLRFVYPKVLPDQKKFVWKGKLIDDSTVLIVATHEQHESLRNLFLLLISIEVLVVILATALCIKLGPFLD